MNETNRPVLVVEGEAASRRLLNLLLTRAGYHVRLAASAGEAMDQVTILTPAIIVLALVLPDMNGLDLCREFRTWMDVPIIIVAVDKDEPTTVKALDAGADDFIVRPFGHDELLARIRAVLRRVRGTPTSPILKIGEVQLDQVCRQVTVAQHEVHLTPTEYELVKYLMSNAGKVVTYATLLRAVWGDAYEDASPTLRVFIAQLRRKLEPDPDRPTYILTEPRIGYRFRGTG